MGIIAISCIVAAGVLSDPKNLVMEIAGNTFAVHVTNLLPGNKEV